MILKGSLMSIIYAFDTNKYIEFRQLSSEDSLKALTVLLNRSYKFLLDMGLRYVAATQDESITMNRVNKACKCFVGIHEGDIVSTISLYTHSTSGVSEWYKKKNVAKFGQFAVMPELQKYGIGSRMIELVENEARKMEGVTELALDTAETAHHLIEYYARKGYRYVETIQWDETNYKSVIMSKRLKEDS
ncbi:MAG TPA: GNAT family N-acetyltransferase [Clostridiales bacterium UBA8960]|nr:GNAT family N-acetyltransferase [Clostridiales bacterium UBA8960]